jgi:hypothetical protein
MNSNVLLQIVNRAYKITMGRSCSNKTGGNQFPALSIRNVAAPAAEKRAFVCVGVGVRGRGAEEKAHATFT